MSYTGDTLAGLTLAINHSSLEWQQPNRLVEQALVARGGSVIYFGGATGDIIEFESICGASDFASLQTIRDYKRIVTFIADVVGQHYPANSGLYVVVDEARFRERAGFTSATTRNYPYKFRLRVVGDLDNYKRATLAETTLGWHTFSMVNKPVITLPTGMTSPSQTVTGTRTGEDGLISYLQDFKGNYLTYAVTEANLGLNDVEIAWSGTELHMKNGLVEADTRNDEASNKGLIDLKYWNPAGGAYATMGTIEVLAYDTEWRSMAAQYPTIQPLIRNNSEYGSIYLTWEQTSTCVGLIGELQLYRGRPFVGLKLINYGIPALKGICVRVNLAGTAHRYWVPGTGAIQDAQSAAHGTPDTVSATADDAAYCYCMDTAAVGIASLLGGVIVRTKANGRVYAAYDSGNYWSYVDQRFNGTTMANVATGNELEQFYVFARKYENANDNPAELAKEAMAQVDQTQTVVKTT